MDPSGQIEIQDINPTYLNTGLSIWSHSVVTIDSKNGNPGACVWELGYNQYQRSNSIEEEYWMLVQGNCIELKISCFKYLLLSIKKKKRKKYFLIDQVCFD